MAASLPTAQQPHEIMKAALKDSILAIYDDTSLNADGKLAQIKKLLKFKDKAAATLGPPSSGSATPKKTVTEEADDDMTVNESLEEAPAGSTLLEEHFDDLRMTISPRIF